MPPPMTSTSKCLPAISSIAAARVSIGAPSVEEDGRGGGLGTGRDRALLAGVAEMEQADEALAGGQADRGPAGLAAQQAGGAPVAGEATGVGGEQDDVGGDRGGVQILLGLVGVVALDRGDDDQGRAAVELGGALGTGRVLQPSQS